MAISSGLRGYRDVATVNGTANAATITAYRPTSNPLIEAGTRNASAIWGSRPIGSISVVTARPEAAASERRPGRLERTPPVREAVRVTTANILA